MESFTTASLILPRRFGKTDYDLLRHAIWILVLVDPEEVSILSTPMPSSTRLNRVEKILRLRTHRSATVFVLNDLPSSTFPGVPRPSFCFLPGGFASSGSYRSWSWIACLLVYHIHIERWICANSYCSWLASLPLLAI